MQYARQKLRLHLLLVLTHTFVSCRPSVFDLLVDNTLLGDFLSILSEIERNYLWVDLTSSTFPAAPA